MSLMSVFMMGIQQAQAQPKAIMTNRIRGCDLTILAALFMTPLLQPPYGWPRLISRILLRNL